MDIEAADFPGAPAPARRRRQPPATLQFSALLVGAAVLLPVVYLTIRALDAGVESVADILLGGRIAAIIARSLVLVAIVSVASALIALALGWFIEQTDLPGRRMWSLLIVLPLVIPSYVVAFLFIAVFSPRGVIQRIFAEPFGINEMPSLYGLPGAAIVLTLVSYPYPLLTVRAALRGSGRALENASRTLGKGPWRTFARVTSRSCGLRWPPEACSSPSTRSVTSAPSPFRGMRRSRGRSRCNTPATWIARLPPLSPSCL